LGDVTESGQQAVLRSLRQANPDITAAVLATADGFAVHADAAGEVDGDALAATAADISLRASKMVQELGQGDLREIVVVSANGYILSARVSDDLCLAVTARSGATLGLLIVSVRKAAGELAE